MNEQLFGNSSAELENETEFDRKKIAKLSKSEILELIEKTPDSKNEILKKIPNEVYWAEGIDQNIVETCNVSRREGGGVQVGSVEVRDKKTDEKVELILYSNRTIYYDKDKLEEPVYRYTVIDSEGDIVAYMLLEDYSEDLLQNDPDISKNLLNYTGDSDKKSESFTHIETMLAKNEKDKYKGCGIALHQVAIEHSLRNGFEGRVQLGAAGFASPASGNVPVVTSAGFHENFGYSYKDVFDKNDNLHHKGDDVHEDLARSRWTEAQKWKKEYPEEKMPMIKDSYRPGSDSALYVYLSEEVILREKERMLKHQNLQVNLETLDALEKKSS